MPAREVLIVGAGPSGLATAIACRHHGLDYQVLEQGTLVDAIARFPTNMVFFTTPELLEVGGVPLTTPYEKPTRAEALRYYRKVTDLFQLQVALHEQVLAVEAGSVSTGCATPAPWSCRWATTTAPICSACPVKTCRTSRTSTASRTPTTGSAW
jgi:hypothetical protein